MQILDLGKMRSFLLSPRTAQTTLVHNAGWKSFDNNMNHRIKDWFWLEGTLKVIQTSSSAMNT